MTNEDALELLGNAPVKIGLRQQGHMKTVARMLSAGATWDEIGAAIGWHGPTAQDWFGRELLAELELLRRDLTAICDEHYECQTGGLCSMLNDIRERLEAKGVVRT
jgi:hypothetical protein